MICQQIFTHGPNRTGQRIARTQRTLKICLRQFDSLGLQDHGVSAAFQVNRPPVRLIQTIEGNNGIGFIPRGRLDPSIGHLTAGRFDLGVEFSQLIGLIRVLPVVFAAKLVQFARGLFQHCNLIAQTPGVILQVTEFQPCIGNLRLGFSARCFQLLYTPADCFMLGLVFDFPFGDFSSDGLGGLEPGLPGDGEQQGNQRHPSCRSILPEREKARCWVRPRDGA